MKTLVIHNNGAELRFLTKISIRRCENCTGERGILAWGLGHVPLQKAIEEGSPYLEDVAIVLAGSTMTRSGAHWIKADLSNNFLPAGYATWMYPAICDVQFLASDLVDFFPGQMQEVARYTDDHFGVTSVMAAIKPRDLALAEEEEYACPTCFRKWVQGGSIYQGHLYIRPEGELPDGWLPRIYSKYQPDVSQTDWFFNHSIEGNGYLLVRRQDGLLVANENIVITATDHEPLSLAAGRYVLYHPFPRPARDID